MENCHLHMVSWIEEDNHLIKDKRNSEVHKVNICWNYNRNIPCEFVVVA